MSPEHMTAEDKRLRYADTGRRRTSADFEKEQAAKAGENAEEGNS